LASLSCSSSWSCECAPEILHSFQFSVCGTASCKLRAANCELFAGRLGLASRKPARQNCGHFAQERKGSMAKDEDRTSKKQKLQTTSQTLGRNEPATNWHQQTVFGCSKAQSSKLKDRSTRKAHKKRTESESGAEKETETETERETDTDTPSRGPQKRMVFA